MSEAWTIRKILDWMSKDFTQKGIESAKLDAELLVAEVLRLTRMQVFMDLDRPLATEELAAVRALVARRRTREPIAYILGRRDFHGATFAVDARVLVPRPDTEILVERALAAMSKDASSRLLDLCTGSGAVPIACLRARSLAQALATDVSTGALDVTRANAKALGVDARLETRAGDLFAAVQADERFDVITANPPYIESAAIADLMPDVARFEPRLALDGGRRGLDFYPRLVAGAAEHLADGAPLALEVGAGQANDVAAMFAQDGRYDAAVVTNDYGGVERVVEARRLPR